MLTFQSSLLFVLPKYIADTASKTSAYGTVIGSCAMAFLPTGGLYVTGGLLSNILKSNDANWEGICNSDNAGSSTQQESPMGIFLEAYRSKGRASFLLDDIPLCLVLAKDAGLRGAAVRAEMVCSILLPIH